MVLLTLPKGEMLFEIPGEENFEALPEQDNCPAFRLSGKFINSLAFNSIPQAGAFSSGSFANSVAGSFHAVFTEKPFSKIEKSIVSDQVLFSISSCSKESEKLFLIEIFLSGFFASSEVKRMSKKNATIKQV